MYQQIIIVGNLGKDPELKYLGSGDPVASFSVATNRKYNNKNGEKVEEVTWFRVSVWGKQAEACNTYLKKGSKVLVDGRLISDAATGGPKLWTRQDGTSGASFEINAETVRFLDGPSEKRETSGNGETPDESLI